MIRRHNARVLVVAILLGASLIADSLEEMTSPIDGLRVREVRDMFDEIHNGHPHRAIDIMEPRGTPVHAVVSGTVGKLFLSKPGGLTIYELDAQGVYCYYYAHLDRYAENLHEQARVERGDVIGFVGSTGNADPKSPHLHFEISRLGPERHWWKGEPINPYQFLIQAIQRGQSR